MTPLCKNYSTVNKCCRFNYETPLLLNIKDIDPKCDGHKTSATCTWYKPYYNWREFP